MQRTTIMLPSDLKHLAESHARRSGRSLGHLIRDALEKELRRKPKHGARDSLFEDLETFDQTGPGDVAERHDDYLYGERRL